MLLTSRHWCVHASCYYLKCSSSIKVSMTTRSIIRLKENSGRIAAPDGVGCKPHLLILSTYIFTLWKCLCSSYVHLVHVLTAEESLERDGMGKNSLGWIKMCVRFPADYCVKYCHLRIVRSFWKAWENNKNVTKCDSSGDTKMIHLTVASGWVKSFRFIFLEGRFLHFSELQVGDVYLCTATLHHHFNW